LKKVVEQLKQCFNNFHKLITPKKIRRAPTTPIFKI
jgi:hypothetical protein